MLLLRVVTSLVLIPLILAVVVYGSDEGFALFIGVSLLFATWEWSGLIQFKQHKLRYIYTLTMLLALVGLYFTWTMFMTLIVAFMALLWWVYVLYVILGFQKNQNHFSSSVFFRSFYGVLLFIPAWLSVIALRASSNEYSEWVLVLLILIWMADSAAYFTGRTFGKTRLAHRVSPGKSWEGVAGAFLIVVITAFYYAHWQELPVLLFIGVCVCTTIFSIIGDLFESVAKRCSDTKDSGQLLPGHGGFLDRLDSLFAAAPVFYLGIYTLNNYL